jgi:hypothetical protein
MRASASSSANSKAASFDEPDYRRIYATCRPGRLKVEFDPDSEEDDRATLNYRTARWRVKPD